MSERVNPIISIIVPVYNVEEYLEECITSILHQEFSEFELILVDDGSTDRSGSLCNEYAKKDERIAVIHQKNAGLSEARNTGIQAAKGSFISFLDSDDFIHPAMYQLLYQNVEESDSDISVCDFQYIYSHKQAIAESVKNEYKVISNLEAVESIVRDGDRKMITAWCKLYRKNLFEDLTFPKGRYHEDEYITYRLFYQANTVAVSEAKLYYYRQRNNSITGSCYSLKRLDKLEALKDCIGFFMEKEEKELEIAARYRYLCNLQIAYYRVSTDMKQEKQLLKDLKDEHKKQYKEIMSFKNKKGRKIDKLTIGIFHLAPFLYNRLAKIYLVINPNA